MSAWAADWLLPVNVRHVLTDQPGHTPRGLIRHAKLALQFLGTDAVPRRREQVDRVKPQLQRGARLFKRSADRGVQVVAAPLAGIGALGLDPIPVRRALAGRALEVLPEPHVE